MSVPMIIRIFFSCEAAKRSVQLKAAYSRLTGKNRRKAMNDSYNKIMELADNADLKKSGEPLGKAGA